MSGCHWDPVGYPTPQTLTLTQTRHGLHPDFDNFWILDPTRCPLIVMEGKRDDT